MSAFELKTKLPISITLGMLLSGNLFAQVNNPPFANIHADAISRSDAFILARGGEAWLYNDKAAVESRFLQNVYKSFGLSSDARYFLYLKANGRFPTFSLYCYDLTAKTERKLTNNSVHHAVWSPSGHMLAYIWLDSNSLFHVSTYDIVSGKQTDIGMGRLRPNFLEWAPNGVELLYISVTPLTKNGVEDSQLGYALHRYAVREGKETIVPDVEWAAFSGAQLLVLSKKTVNGYQNLLNPKREDIRRVVVSNGNIYASTVERGQEFVKRWNAITGTFDTLGRGRLDTSNDRGVVIREYTKSDTNYHYLSNGALQTRPLGQNSGTFQDTSLASGSQSKTLLREMSGPQAGPLAQTPANWKMPFGGLAYVVQGGQSYGNGACDGTQCFITAHQGLLEYSLDWQQRAEENQGNTHVLAIGEGTVVGTLNTVTCNRIITSCSVGWDDYSPNCEDPTGGIGNYVSIAHLDGTFSFYSHLKSGSVQVAPNQNVLQGTYLGVQGHSGAAGTYNNYLNCGDHLHFSRQVGPAPWEQSVPTDFGELPCMLGCPAAYASANVEIASAPVLTSVSPASGFAGSTTQVTLSGSNFVYGATVNASNAAITVTSTLLESGTKLTATLSIAAGATAGAYSITVTTANGTSNPIGFTVTPAGTGGALSGSIATPSGTQNLTALGTADWAHWGLSSATSFNHKAQQISNYTIVGSGSATMYGGNPVTYSWTDGTPTASATTATGVYIAGQNKGFRITVPADTSTKTVTVYVGVWSAQGRLVAHLSDNSAPDYINTSLNNSSGTTVGLYTLNYRAGSSGQTLTLTYTANNVYHSYGNVTLQAATLVSGVVTPDYSISASPASQSVLAGGSTTYPVSVSSVGGFNGSVGFSVSGLPVGASGSFVPVSVTGSGSSTLSVTTGGSTAAGSYPLTITGTSGSLTRTANVTLVVTAGGGSGALTGSIATPSGTQNLTALGTADWAHWGLTSGTSFNHKGQEISNYTVVGSGSVQNFGDNTIGYSWTGGTPTASATNTTTGVFLTGQNNGFRITVPADTSVKTVTVYLGAWAAQGRLVAHLSDNSAADYIDTSVNDVNLASASAMYTFNYRAASPGQTLTLTYTANNVYHAYGNVTLQAATLIAGAATPDFSLSATPTSQSVASGSSTTYSLNVSSISGFTGTVNLSISGLPAGVTGAFVPASVDGSGSSVLTVTSSSGTAAGTYPLTITGVSGSLTHTANVSLVITPASDFSIAATPGSRSVPAGGTTSYTANVSASNGFNGNVGLSVNGLPAGATGAFAPASVTGSGSSTLTVTSSSSTAAGTYPLTITGVSGSLTHTANVSLVITPAADFSIAATPGSRSVPAGGTTSYTANVSALNGFNGNVGLSVSGLPAGATGAFAPASVTGSGSSTLTVTSSSGTAAGTYPLTITGVSGSLTHTANVSLVITPAADFSIAATPGSRSILAGGNTSYTANVSALNGFNGNVGLSVSGLPAGATGAFAPASVTGSGSSTLTVTSSSGTAAGTYPLTITGVSGSLTRTANVTLSVTPVGTGGALSGSIATPSGTQNLTALGTADWAHWGLSSATSFNHKAQQISNYTIVGSGSATRYGGNPVTYSWTGGTPTASATTATGVYIAGQNKGFRITVPADTSTKTVTVYVGVWSAQGRLVAHLSDNSAPDYINTSLNNSSGTTVGLYTLNYRAGSSGQTLTLTFTQNNATSGNVTLQAATLVSGVVTPDYSISASPASQSVLAGGSTTYPVSVSSIGGFNGSVGFSVSGLPVGASGSFVPVSVTGSGSSTLSVTTGGSTAAGSYPLTITGTSGSLTRTANVTLVVTAGGGSGALTGSIATPSGTQNLTALGTADWAHWGLTSGTSFNHKGQEISNYTVVGSGSVQNFGDNTIGYSWTGGTPTASATNTTTGVFLTGQNNGFRITVPADTSVKTVTVYLGAWAAQGRLVAHLSDNSAADYIDTSVNDVNLASASAMYTFNYRAASPGQTLTLTYTANNVYHVYGNVTLQAATLR